MSTSAHLTSFSRTCCALGDFRSRAMPRLLRLARCQGYASSATGCGGRWFAIRHRSPCGGSTLTTSAPKSDRITAALGPAMKLARSTTFKPENTESIVFAAISSPFELGDALLEEGRSPFLFVVGRRAQREQRGLERET